MIEYLNDLAPLVQKALDQDGNAHTLEDVERMIEEGHAVLWPGPNSVIITQIDEKPQLKTLHFFIAAGVLEEIEVMYPSVLAWGEEIGCDRAVLVGRKGWERSFLTRNEGWRVTHTVMTKELGNGKRHEDHN